MDLYSFKTKNPAKQDIFDFCGLEGEKLEHLYRSLVYQYQMVKNV